MEGLQRELWDISAEQIALKGTVLAFTTAVTGLMEEASSRAPLGLLHDNVDARFKAHVKAINGQLDLTRQEMKGGGVMVGGVTVGGVTFYG
jgi:hypothetical protein